VVAGSPNSGVFPHNTHSLLPSLPERAQKCQYWHFLIHSSPEQQPQNAPRSPGAEGISIPGSRGAEVVPDGCDGLPAERAHEWLCRGSEVGEVMVGAREVEGVGTEDEDCVVVGTGFKTDGTLW
jgi:hypothetical protein